MEKASSGWQSVMMTAIRLLTFRSTREELLGFNARHLALGVCCAWLVGMGRYWDNPRVPLLQRLGVGSVIYVFALALLLWLIVWPLRPKDWSYFRVCVFVALVSPPAILYAIPVERAFELGTANSINAWFLGIVAAWRVALLVFYLRRSGALEWGFVIIATLLPLTLIVIALTVLNLERVVFDVMGGFTERSGNDTAYSFLFMLFLLSLLLFIPILLCYIILVASRASSKSPENLLKPD
jgi:hypothetical protein